jgi:Ca-activated chloride channel homolog
MAAPGFARDHGGCIVIELAQFHFLRPLWLLAALPAIAIAVALWRQPDSGANWRRTIAPELLDHLLEGRTELRRRWPWLVLAGWLLATFAMAGPTWEKLPQPVLQKRDALVIVLDLSLSMYAEDVPPSRLQRARFKILDILQRRQEGLTGLVVYSGDAHVVSPLTDDTATIANLVPALAPEMMPAYGSDPVAGIDQALQLLRNAGFERGRILLLSDDISDANIEAIAQRVDPAQWQLSLLGVGTTQGAPIPVAPAAPNGKNNRGSAAVAGATSPAGGFLKQADGQIVVAQMHRERFERLAQLTQGRYSELHADDRDLDALLPDVPPRESETRTIQREFDRWRERGPWLAMALLPLAALAFRRGWLLALMVLPLTLPAPATAAETEPSAPLQSFWRDLWQRPDQQAQQTLQAGDAKSAAAQFRDPAWRGAALYRAGEFEAAAKTLQGQDNADADYNRGNALARAGHLQEAIDAYDAALQKAPQSDDAKANRALVEKLLQQQKQQAGQQSSDQQKEDQRDPQKQDSSSQQSENQQAKNDGAQDDQSQGQQAQNQSAEQQNQNDRAQAGQNQKDASAAAQNQPEQEKDNGSESQSGQAMSPSDAAPADSDAEPNAPAIPQDETDAATASSDDGKNQGRQARATSDDPAQQQKQRATEQWLRQIPDDPSGLLRRKFLYEHRQRERAAQTRDDEQPLW